MALKIFAARAKNISPFGQYIQVSGGKTLPFGSCWIGLSLRSAALTANFVNRISNYNQVELAARSLSPLGEKASLGETGSPSGLPRISFGVTIPLVREADAQL